MLHTLELKNELREHCNELEKLLRKTEYEQKYTNFKDIYDSISYSDKLRITVLGDWSTGKSTIIKALTGIENIGIATDVKTSETKTYEYKDIYIVDTPGLNSGNADHTDKADKALLNSDRIIYCITAQQLFDDTNIDDFVNIVNYVSNPLSMTSLKDPIILAVTKFGLEGNDPTECLSNICNQIADYLEEKDVSSNQYTYCIFNAERYINGVRSNNDNLIEASFFDEFMNIIECPSSNNIELLSLNKCGRQTQFMLRFISNLIDEIKEAFTEEDKRRLMEVTQGKQKELRNRQKEVKKKVINGINDVLNAINILLNDENPDQDNIVLQIKSKINDLAEDVAGELSNENAKSRETINSLKNMESHIYVEPLPEKKQNIFFSSLNKSKENNGSGFFKTAGAVMKDGIEKLNDMAAPVKIGINKQFLKKPTDIMSEIGGKGTYLSTLFTKVFPKKGEAIAKSLGKLSNKLSTVAKIAPYAGVAIDTVVGVGESISKNRESEKHFALKSNLKNSLCSQITNIKREFFSGIDEYFEKEIDDTVGYAADLQNANSNLISRLYDEKRKIENIKDMIENT